MFTLLKKHLKILVAFTAAVLLLSIAVFWFFAHRGVVTWRWGVAECLVWQGENLTQRFILSEEEAQPVQQLVEELAQKIDAGELSARQGMQVIASFYQGPVFMALIQASLENYLRQASLPEDFVAAEMLAVSANFFKAAQNAEIAATDFAEIEKNLMNEKILQTATRIGLTLPEKTLTFRKHLSLAELMVCCDKMKTLVRLSPDQARFPSPAEALRKILVSIDVK